MNDNLLGKTVWAPSNKCNQDCDFCYNYVDEKIFTLETYFQMADKLKELGANRFIWGGGEPLLFGHIESLMDYAASIDIQNVLVTNGRALTTERLDAIRPDEIRISIHSLDPAFNQKHRISYPGEFYEDTILRNLYNASTKDVRLCTSTVYLGQSEIDLLQMAEQFARAGVKEWTFQELTNIRGNAVNINGICTTDHILQVVNRLNELDYPLKIAFNSADRLNNEYEAVNPSGELTAVRGGKDIVIGNAATDSVELLREGLEQIKNCRNLSYEKEC